jgi:ankyrin repeat protein
MNRENFLKGMETPYQDFGRLQEFFLPLLQELHATGELDLDSCICDCEGTLLLHAVTWNDEAMTRFLVSEGTDISASDDLGFTALHLAVDMAYFHGEVSTLTLLLLENGAPVNAQTDDGRTALHEAFRSGPAVQKLLVEWGADMEMRTRKKILCFCVMRLKAAPSGR